MSQIFLGSFHGNATGRQNQSDAFLNHLTVSGKSVLQCTTLTASQTVSADGVRCKTAVLGGLSVSGAAEICDIQCPNNFLLSAQENVRIEAEDNAVMVSNTGPVFLLAGAQGPTATSNLSLLSNGSASLNAKTTTTVQASEGQLLLECQDTGQAGGADCCVSIAGHLNSKSGAVPGSTYIPTLGAGTTAANVSIVNGSVDTCGKLNLATPLAQGDIIQLRFGTPFTNPPVVQITSTNPDITGVTATGEIALHQVSNVVFVLVCVAANQLNTNIHYTVIGQND